MPEPTQPKEWHEDEGNTARAVTDSPDEQAGEEDLLVNEWGEEDEQGYVIPPHVKQGEE